jgi:hypothetical protein
MTYCPGDTFSYKSVNQGHWVTFTRNEAGEWWADDGRLGPASDTDIPDERSSNSVYTPSRPHLLNDLDKVLEETQLSPNDSSGPDE